MFLVQTFLHKLEDSDSVRVIATEMDSDAQRRGFQTLEIQVPIGMRIGLHLLVPGLKVHRPVTTTVWSGRTRCIQFTVRVSGRRRRKVNYWTVTAFCQERPGW